MNREILRNRASGIWGWEIEMEKKKVFILMSVLWGYISIHGVISDEDKAKEWVSRMTDTDAMNYQSACRASYEYCAFVLDEPIV